MIKCSQCGAPNPGVRDTCFSCQQLLAPAPKPEPPPVHSDLQLGMRPCPSCQQPIAVYWPACRHCGAVLAAAPVLLSGVPDGWKCEQLGAGAIRLTRSMWSSTAGAAVGQTVAQVALLVGFGLAFAVWELSQQRLPAALVLPLGAVPAIVSCVLMKETWDLEPDRLQIRLAFLKWNWLRSYSGGSLSVGSILRITRTGPKTTWYLWLAGPPGRVTLASSSFRTNHLHSLAQLISTHTGWPLKQI